MILSLKILFCITLLLIAILGCVAFITSAVENHKYDWRLACIAIICFISGVIIITTINKNTTTKDVTITTHHLPQVDTIITYGQNPDTVYTYTFKKSNIK